MRIDLDTHLQCVVWNVCEKVHVRCRLMSTKEAFLACRETLREDFYIVYVKCSGEAIAI